MGNRFFIGDTHFGHANIIKFCNRPFTDVDHMRECLIENWNKVVRKHDTVWHLGDFFFGSTHTVERLNGEIKLVLGNHDKYTQLVGKIHKFYGAAYLERDIILTHIPVHPQNLGTRFRANIHGHMHDTEIVGDKRYINVSVEQINYTPISWEELRKKYNL